MSVSVDNKPALVYPQPGGVYSKDPEGKIPIKGNVQPAKADVPAGESPATTKSYNRESGALDKLRTPIATRSEKVETALTNVGLKTAQADALVAPELLSAVVGGQGSGLRMNEAEIRRIMGGRSSLEDLKALGQKLASGQSITDSQRAQVTQILQYMKMKVDAKQRILEKAQNDLIDASNPTDHRRISSGAKTALEKIDEGKFITREEMGKIGVSEGDVTKKGYVIVE